MSLVKRELSSAEVEARRANSRHSTGPQTARGKATASLNLLRSRPFSELEAAALGAIEQCPEELENIRKILAAALQPRDVWEDVWVQDIAILRWRLARLHRAEVGRLAVRKRCRLAERRLAAAEPKGSTGLQQLGLMRHVGFTGIADSATKFQHTLETLKNLRDLVASQAFNEEAEDCFLILYGTGQGPHGAMLKAKFDAVAEAHKGGETERAQKGRDGLLNALEAEIASYEQLQAAYATLYLDADPLQDEAELILRGDELNEIIRYETHLEAQLERKLRQFYARRREPVWRAPGPGDQTPEATESAPEAGTAS